MGVEIERKFLLASDAWRARVRASRSMRQGYLVDVAAIERGFARCSVRVRISGGKARLNIKSAQLGLERAEYEYPVPLVDAEEWLSKFCSGVLSKTRHLVDVDGHTFEIDEFEGSNAGLVVAELELPAANADFPRPPWLGRDVSHLPRYYNVNLISHPWRDWSPAERAGDDDPCC